MKHNLNSKKLPHKLGVLLLVKVVGGLAVAPRLLNNWQRSRVKNEVTITTVIPTGTPTDQDVGTSRVLGSVLPERVKLDVPFTSQAPFAVWDEQLKEVCEEALIIMAQWYAGQKQGTKKGGFSNLIPPETVSSLTGELIQWQKSAFGYYEDTNTQETFRMLTEKLAVKNASSIKDVSADSLKRELSQGNLIIVPVAGKVPENPYFRGARILLGGATLMSFERFELIPIITAREG